MSNYAGIDYAGPGATCNRDPGTNIRYGVISCNSIDPDALDWGGIEYDYGSACCPECGNNVIESSDDSVSDAEWNTGTDYVCVTCDACYWSDEVYSDEALGWTVDSDGYHVQECLDNDAMVCKSPYYTYAQFCGPCVPGACSLDDPIDPETGPKVYCLGHDWFDGGIAPYDVYDVDTNVMVPAPEQKS